MGQKTLYVNRTERFSPIRYGSCPIFTVRFMSGPTRSNVVRSVELSDQPEAAAPTNETAAPAADARKEAVRPAEAPVAQTAKKKRPNLVLPVIVLALLGAGGWYGYHWWTDGRFMVSTDDAYIGGDIAIIAPKVAGYIKTVNVKDNQTVKAGDLLVTLDGGDYQLALDAAKANVESAHLAVDRMDAQIAGAQATLEQTEAQLGALEATVRGAQITQKRAAELAAKSVGTTADLDNAQVALDQATANLIAGRAGVTTAKANIDLLQAQRREAVNTIRAQEIARDQAARDLSFTELRAPYDGVVGNLSMQVGDLVSVGRRLAALVPIHDLYIDANFKETQIADLVPGSKVNIHVDAYGSKPIEGTVASIAPASGSVFSLLPAENATGNFTKVVQRVPVRIAIPEQVLAEGHLRAGLSVVVDVDTRTAPTRVASN